MKNSQEIPKKWCILRTEENYKEVNEWFNKMYPDDTKDGIGYEFNGDYIYSENVFENAKHTPKVALSTKAPNHNDFTEITTEQFREWILKDNKK